MDMSMQDHFFQSEMKSPIGVLKLYATETHLLRVSMEQEKLTAAAKKLQQTPQKTRSLHSANSLPWHSLSNFCLEAIAENILRPNSQLSSPCSCNPKGKRSQSSEHCHWHKSNFYYRALPPSDRQKRRTHWLRRWTSSQAVALGT